MKLNNGKMFAPAFARAFAFGLAGAFALATEAFAQTGGGGGGPSALAGLAPFALLFVLFYFLIIRPQQKRNRKRQDMLKSLKRGDSVITGGGLYATITEMGATENDPVVLEIAKGVTVRATLSSVASKAEEKTGG